MFHYLGKKVPNPNTVNGKVNHKQYCLLLLLLFCWEKQLSSKSLRSKSWQKQKKQSECENNNIEKIK